MQGSTTADHCLSFALSDSKDKSLTQKCDHPHNQFCQSCEKLKSTLSEVKSLVNTTVIAEDKDDLLYCYEQAAQAINAWKSHILRSVQQDKARTDILELLDNTTALITQDWAMKFLPQKNRETQQDWYGKRGISWHICVVVRKVNSKLQHQTMIHIVKNALQESETVLWIMEHTLATIKRKHPELSTAYFRQDNAGCYHSVAVLSACPDITRQTGVHIKRVDFSDPQGGKGACDRKAATVKGHVRRFINEGHDVLTAEDFKEAILSFGGLDGVRVALVDQITTMVSVKGKWEGVSHLNNFLYPIDVQGVTLWRSYHIGEGKTLPWEKLPGESNLHFS